MKDLMILMTLSIHSPVKTEKNVGDFNENNGNEDLGVKIGSNPSIHLGLCSIN